MLLRAVTLVSLLALLLSVSFADAAPHRHPHSRLASGPRAAPVRAAAASPIVYVTFHKNESNPVASYALLTGALINDAVLQPVAGYSLGDVGFGASAGNGRLLVTNHMKGEGDYVDIYSACDASGRRAFVQRLITSAAGAMLTGVAVGLDAAHGTQAVWVSGSEADPFTQQYDLSSGALEETLFHGGTGGVAYDGETNRVYIACVVCGKILAYDARAAAPLPPLSLPSTLHPVDVSFDTQSRLLVISDVGGALYLWDVDAGKIAFQTQLLMPSAALLYDGLIYALSNNTQLVRIDPADPKPQPTLLVDFQQYTASIFISDC